MMQRSVLRPTLPLLVLRLSIWGVGRACAESVGSAAAPRAQLSSEKGRGAQEFSLVGLQLCHRHGDRAPNVHLANGEEWQGVLPDEATLDLLGRVARWEGPAPAPGGDVWGRLSKVGIAQLRTLGAMLSESLGAPALPQDGASDALPRVALDGETMSQLRAAAAFDVDLSSFPLPPIEEVAVFSTGPPWTTTRTIESVQSLLSGMYPQALRGAASGGAAAVGIDPSLTRAMIPDRSDRPAAVKALEQALAAASEGKRPQAALYAARRSITEAMVRDGALSWENKAAQPGKWVGDALKWTALMEVLRCMDEHMASRVPPEARPFRELVGEHAVHRWFDVYGGGDGDSLTVAMHNAGAFGKRVLDHAVAGAPATLQVYSAHDATLITLMAALDLDYRGWPPYASLLRVERLRRGAEDYVRFVLNGAPLRIRDRRLAAIGAPQAEGAIYPAATVARLRDFVGARLEACAVATE